MGGFSPFAPRCHDRVALRTQINRIRTYTNKSSDEGLLMSRRVFLSIAQNHKPDAPKG